MLLRQLFKNQVLGEVSVLVLVHKNIVETGRYRLLCLWKIPKQDIHIQQYVVEVHHSRVLALLGVAGVDVAYSRLSGMGVVDDRLLVVPVGGRGDEVVLRHGYS